MEQNSSTLIEKARLVAAAECGHVRDALRAAGYDSNLSILAQDLSKALLQSSVTTISIDLDKCASKEFAGRLSQHELERLIKSGREYTRDCARDCAVVALPIAIGKMVYHGPSKGIKDYEVQHISSADEYGFRVVDMDGTLRRPNKLLWELEVYPSANDNDSKWEGREFGKGCTVYLKPGGPAMKVMDFYAFADALKYQCEWNTHDGLHSDWFRPTSLSRTQLGDPSNDNKQMQLYSEAFAAQRALEKLAEVVEPARLDVMRRLLVLQDTCYGLANNAGWWKDLESGTDVREWPKVHLDNWISAKLMLTVTEVAEAMEGHRKGLMDDKLPHRQMLEVELADAVIRIMDLAGGLNLDVAGAIVEKLAFNMTREDHKIENRKAAGGKSV